MLSRLNPLSPNNDNSWRALLCQLPISDNCHHSILKFHPALSPILHRRKGSVWAVCPPLSQSSLVLNPCGGSRAIISDKMTAKQKEWERLGPKVGKLLRQFGDSLYSLNIWFNFNYVRIERLCVCIFITCVPGANTSQRRELDSPQLEFRMILCLGHFPLKKKKSYILSFPSSPFKRLLCVVVWKKSAAQGELHY